MADRSDHLRAGQPGPGDPARRGARRCAPTRSSPPAAATIPNQVNNVLGFPFIFRGALDVARDGDQRGDEDGGDARARRCSRKEDVPDSVAALYGLARRAVRPRLPDSLPVRSARAALGRARGRVGRGRERRRHGVHRPRRVPRPARGAARPRARLMRGIINRARQRSRSASCFPKARSRRSSAPRASRRRGHRACRSCSATARRSSERARAAQRSRSTDIEIEDPATSPQARASTRSYLWERRQRKGMSLDEARRRLLQRQLLRLVMVARGDADALRLRREPCTIRRRSVRRSR